MPDDAATRPGRDLAVEDSLDVIASPMIDVYDERRGAQMRADSPWVRRCVSAFDFK